MDLGGLTDTDIESQLRAVVGYPRCNRVDMKKVLNSMVEYNTCLQFRIEDTVVELDKKTGLVINRKGD